MAENQPTILNKEAIAARMFRHAARYWGYSDTNVDNFDPLVRLLIEACAVELYRISNEIASVQERMLEKLARLLTPEVHTAPKPAHSVLHACPTEKEAWIFPQMQFFSQRKFASKANGPLDLAIDIFFSPATKYKIVDGDVAFIASGTHVYALNDAQSKETFLNTLPGKRFESRQVWLGVKLSGEIGKLDGVSFFFDLKNHPDKNRLLKLVKFTKWSLKNNPLHTAQGIAPAEETFNEDDLFFDLEEFDLNKSITKVVEAFYQNQFVRVTEQSNAVVSFERYPVEFESLLSSADLPKFQSQLVWIKLVFLADFDEQALDELSVHLNCFPVVNRHLNEIRYRVQSNFNIVPLLSTEQFLSLHRVQGTEGNSEKENTYVSSPFDTPEINIKGTFSLRAGDVERFDSRNAVEYMNYLVELLRDESRAFAALGQDFVSSLIKELNQNIAQIDQKVKQNISLLNQAPVYLLVNPKTEGDNLFIEFWTTNGTAANFIRSGSRLELYEGSDVRAETIVLVTGTTGGADKMKNTEVLGAYKSSLMTRGRLVTIEDVRSYCNMLLQDKAKKIDVKKGVGIGVLPNEGLVHTIDIEITPARAQSDSDEWSNLLQDVETRLQQHSAAWVNYRVMIQ